MSSGFSNPIIGGGGTLVYPAIQSPNFSIAGQSGWAIMKNGNAYFFNITATGDITASEFEGNNFVLTELGLFFYNGTPGADNPPVSYVIPPSTTEDPFGNPVGGLQTIASSSGQMLAHEITTDNVFLKIYTGRPDEQTPAYHAVFTENNGDSDEYQQYTIAGPAISAFTDFAWVNFQSSAADGSGGAGGNLYYTDTSGAVHVLLEWGSGGVIIHSGQIVANQPGTTLTDETWHYVGNSGQPGFGSGWSNVGSSNAKLAFKLLAEKNLILIRGYVANATASNTAAIFTLPTGYVPTSQQIFALVENGDAYGNSLVVETSGAVKLFNSAGAGDYAIDALVSLDI